MKVKQPYDEARSVPWLAGRVVQPGEVVAVPDGDLAHYLEAGWHPADDRTLAAAKALLADDRISRLAGVDEPAGAGADEPVDAGVAGPAEAGGEGEQA